MPPHTAAKVQPDAQTETMLVWWRDNSVCVNLESIAVPVSVGVCRHTTRKLPELRLQFTLFRPKQYNFQSQFLRNTGELCAYSCKIKVLLSRDNTCTGAQARSLLVYIFFIWLSYLLLNKVHAQLDNSTRIILSLLWPKARTLQTCDSAGQR